MKISVIAAIAAVLTLCVSVTGKHSCDNEVADIMFVLDDSGSVQSKNFQKVKTFVKDMVNSFKIGINNIHVGAITFSTKPKLQFNMHKYYDKKRLQRAISKIRYRGGRKTYTHMALGYLRRFSFKRRAGGRAGVPNIAIVITDGKSYNKALTAKAALKLRKMNTIIFAIGIGKGIGKAELVTIGSSPSSMYVYTVNNFNVLKYIEKTLIKRTCAVDPCTVKPCKNGGLCIRKGKTYTCSCKAGYSGKHCTQVDPCTVKPCKNGGLCIRRGKTYRCACKAGYSGKHCTQACDNEVADIMFMLDDSGSVQSKNFQKVKTFVKDMVNSFKIGINNIHVGAITFSTKPKLQFNMHKYYDKKRLQRAISKIRYRGGRKTYTHMALGYLRRFSFKRRAGGRAGVPNIAIVITDGKSYNKALTAKAALKLRKMNTIIFAIGIGKGIGKAELVTIGSSPSSMYVYTVNNFNVLKYIEKTLIKRTCAVDPCTVKPCKNGGLCIRKGKTYTCSCKAGYSGKHCTQVDPCTVKPCKNGGLCIRRGKTYRCACKAGYSGKHCTQACDNEVADIMFVLDDSGSVQSKNFQKVKTFVKDMVNSFKIGINNIHVGAITFSTKPKLQFNMHKYYDKKTLQLAISKIRYRRGGTYTHLVLDYLRRFSFKRRAGGRAGVPNIAIVITDGKSYNKALTAKAALKLRKMNTIIFAIGIGKGIGKAELVTIGSSPSSMYVYTVNNFNVLKYIEKTLIKRTCAVDQCTVKPCKNGGLCIRRGKTYTCSCKAGYSGKHCTQVDPCTVKPCKNGGLCIRRGKTYRCSCKAGYSGKHCTQACDNEVADIMFVLDDSGSVQSKNFQKVKTFVKDMVNSFKIGINNIHVGAITFSTKPKLQFNMHKYYDKKTLQWAISKIRYRRGGTYTHLVLDYLRRFSFKRRAGGRAGVPNIAIVITDGKSYNKALTAKAALKLRKMNTIIFAIGIGNGIGKAELVTIGSSPSSMYVYTVNNFNVLKYIEKTLIKRTCAVDQCTVKPCKNGGLCIRRGKTYTCSCKAGYSGKHCTQVDPCTVKPCKNGGLCIRRGKIYTCSCKAGYSGKHCTQVDPCTVKPCKNGGLCIRRGKTYTCSCKAGYSGKHCTQVDPCTVKPCKNGGLCIRRGKTYTCSCKAGYSGKHCTQGSCVCAASGDPHYKTYDGQMIHFMGTCKYTLTATIQGTTLTQFSVEVKNEHRGRNKKVAYTRLVDLKYGGNTLRLLPNGKLTINGRFYEMPLNNYMGFTVRYAAGWVIATIDIGLQLKFDGNHRIIVKVPGTYRNQLTGICGDCNGKKDDWRTKTGVDVSKRSNKYSLIGGSYEVSDDSDKPEKNCQSTDVENTCNSAVTHPCNALINKTGIFGKCVNNIFNEAINYYKSCQIDVCAYNNDLALKANVLCRSLEAFARRCEDIGALVDWRKSLNCEKQCPQNMEYKYSTSIYQASCTNRIIPRIGRFTEACVCKKGFILSGTECVPEASCGCVYNGLYMKQSTSFMLDDCSMTITCTTNGKLLKKPTCPKNSLCQLVNGYRKCMCKTGYFIQKGDCIVDACVAKPCKNGGVCSRKDKSYTCTCKGGFSGSDCSIGPEASCDNAVADIMFVLDDSGSVDIANFQKVKTFVKDMVNSFKIGQSNIHVGAITFSSKPKLQFNMNKYYDKNELERAISNIPYTRGGTYTHLALDYLRNHAFKPTAGGRAGVPNIAIVITDGKSSNKTLTANAALKLRNINTIIFAIGVGSGIGKAELVTIGSSPSIGYVFTVQNFDVLKSIKKTLIKRTCDVDPCDVKPCKNGGVCSRKGKSYTCSCKAGYSGKDCTEVDACAAKPCKNGGVCSRKDKSYTCTCKGGFSGSDCSIACDNAVADIMFVLDDSGSVDITNFQKVKTFVKDMVNSFKIGQSNIHVGAITFSSKPKLQFNMNKYYDKNELERAISNIPYTRGGTYTHLALDYLRNHSFKPTAGDRAGVPNIAIVITDGKSSNKTLTANAALKLRNINTIIFAIGVGSGIGKAELVTIGSSPSIGYVFTVQNFDVLKSIKKTLIKRTCDVDPCDVKPCKNGGVCSRKGKSYTCSCKAGYSGKDCTEVDPCTVKPCKNGGLCIRRGKTYTCSCKAGYSGKHCTQGPDAFISDCECRASGDPHYNTFDGQMIHFMGACKYTLASTTVGSGLTPFHVEVKNENRGNNNKVSYTRLVDIKLNGVTLRLLPKGRISVNNELLQMPLNNFLGFTVFYSAGWVIATTSFGLKLKFDGNHRVILNVPGSYRGQLTGICGDCNGKKDDWRQKDGTDVTKEKNKYSLIGKSYGVFDDSDKPGKKCDVTDVTTTCPSSVTSVCNRMTEISGIFGACLKKLGTEVANQYFESCKIDVCAYSSISRTLKDVICRSFESLVRKCEDLGFVVNWRAVIGCTLDCSRRKNMVYKVRIAANQPTCTNRNPTSTVYLSDGCVCSSNYILSGNECILTSECGCIYEGIYIKANTTHLLSDCSKSITCLANGMIQKTSSCPKGFECLVEFGKRICKCPPGFAPLNGECKHVIEPPPKPIIDPAFLRPVMRMFIRVTVAYIEGTILEETKFPHVEQCAYKCMKHKKCKSFNYDELLNTCQTYGINAATTVTLTPSECPYKDYFQRIENKVVVIKGASIISCVHLSEFGKIKSEKECKAKCAAHKCKAMEYSAFDSDCSVTHNDQKTYGLIGDDFWKFTVTFDKMPVMEKLTNKN